MITASLGRAWVRVPRPHACPSVRLFCFPHAGAGASTFHPWSGLLFAAGVEMRAIQYPGREDRIGEPLLSTCADLVKALLEVWTELAGTAPYAIFGHSMGALLGLELTRQLEGRGDTNLPQCLFLSGRRPPHLPPLRMPVNGLSDDEFIPRLQAEGVVQLPESVRNDPDLVRLLTRVLRADVGVSDSGLTGLTPRIKVPLSVFGGTQDPWTCAQSLGEWRGYTSARWRLRQIPGDHLFHQSAHRAVITGILADLSEVA